MIIHVKNKNTLIIDDFKFKCCVGKKGLNSDKKEGDKKFPKGVFNLKKLYFVGNMHEVSDCKFYIKNYPKKYELV